MIPGHQKEWCEPPVVLLFVSKTRDGHLPKVLMHWNPLSKNKQKISPGEIIWFLNQQAIKDGRLGFLTLGRRKYFSCFSLQILLMSGKVLTFLLSCESESSCICHPCFYGIPWCIKGMKTFMSIWYIITCQGQRVSPFFLNKGFPLSSFAHRT